MSRFRLLIIFSVLLADVIGTSVASACGGLFCQNVPVDQQAERIIFTINDDSTVSAYVQINYTGEAAEFSWVVPVPSVPDVDVAEMSSFNELSNLTAPIMIPPLMPSCAPVPLMAAGAVEESVRSDGEVQVLASGTAGPYAFDVVTSENPDSLIIWLRDNSYRITEPMEPLVHVYSDEGMAFLAMKLQPDQGAQDIQPIKMTYEAQQPTIPIRLTAVAANPNMTILTWIFADAQTMTTNFARPVIKDVDIRGDFFSFGGTNYLTLVDQTIDLYEGRAFITEYAQPTSQLIRQGVQDDLVIELTRNYDYVTRFFGRMSPEEMTVDPTFSIQADLEPVSNIRDLSNVNPDVFWGCDNQPVELRFDPAVVPAGF